MEIRSKNFIKNYLLERILDTRLYFYKKESDETDFSGLIKNIKKILVVLPIDRTEEINSRKFVKDLQEVFNNARISTLDLANLRKIDTNWLGVPNQHYLKQIQHEKFDLLMDLNGHHDRICAYLGALAGVPLRLHASNGKFDRIYNLEIRSGGHPSLNQRYQTILSYLSQMTGEVAS
jgi:hypothetical protein